MSNKIKDVVKRLRDRAEARRRSGKLLQIDDKMFDLIADEIEDAAKTLEADRDNWRRQALDEDARANATCKDSSHVGNAAKIREALEAINRIDTRGLKRILYELVEADIPDGGQINKTISAVENVRRALSAPARNCDNRHGRGARLEI